MKSGVKSGDLAKFVLKKRNTDYDFPPPNKFLGTENIKTILSFSGSRFLIATFFTLRYICRNELARSC